ncbi:MAG: biotin/lipoyl-binding protein [Chloroflexi bacterium]|nr:biotin/lipoyl-binding protein [Chloroflexota bacterium]
MGKVTTVCVTVGSSIAEGDTICFLESMKMENPIMAPVSGKVVEIKIAPGQVIQTGDLVAVIEY